MPLQLCQPFDDSRIKDGLGRFLTTSYGYSKQLTISSKNNSPWK